MVPYAGTRHLGVRGPLIAARTSPTWSLSASLCISLHRQHNHAFPRVAGDTPGRGILHCIGGSSFSTATFGRSRIQSWRQDSHHMLESHSVGHACLSLASAL